MLFHRWMLVLLIFLSNLTWGQSMQGLNNQGKFKYIFENLTKDTLSLVDEFYHPQVEFIDPVGKINGSAKIRAYYQDLYKNVKSIRFTFQNFYESGDTVIGIWTMTLETDKLNGGKPFSVEGNSVIRFDQQGKAIYHRDYFDMGAFIYENVPVVGFIVRKIREGMAH